MIGNLILGANDIERAGRFYDSPSRGYRSDADNGSRNFHPVGGPIG